MFSNFIEESFELVHTIDYNKKGTWQDNNDEVSQFIKNMKELSTLTHFYPDLLINNKGFMNILNPKAISHVDHLNGPAMKESN